MKKLLFYPLTVIALIAAGQNLMGASNNTSDNFSYDAAVLRVGQVFNGDLGGDLTEEEVIKGILAGGEHFIKKILEVQKEEPTYTYFYETVIRGAPNATSSSELGHSGKGALESLTEWANNKDGDWPSTLDKETLKRWNEAMKAAGIKTTFN